MGWTIGVRSSIREDFIYSLLRPHRLWGDDLSASVHMNLMRDHTPHVLTCASRSTEYEYHVYSLFIHTGVKTLTSSQASQTVVVIN
jgi:hypothetical protein